MKRALLGIVAALALSVAAAHAQQGNPINVPAASGGGQAPCNAFGSTAGTCAQGNGGTIGGNLTVTGAIGYPTWTTATRPTCTGGGTKWTGVNTSTNSIESCLNGVWSPTSISGAGTQSGQLGGL